MYKDIKGKKCGNLNVRPDENGVYPMVDVEYSWKMCNGNDFDIELREEKAKFYDWTKKAGDKNANIANPRFPLGDKSTKILASGTCMEKKEELTLTTANKYNVATQLEGYVLRNNGQRLNSQTSEFRYVC